MYPPGTQVVLTGGQPKCLGLITTVRAGIKFGWQMKFGPGKADLLHQKIDPLPYQPADWDVWHPISWMRPLEDPDKKTIEAVQERSV